jgi:hypothetical protein
MRWRIFVRFANLSQEVASGGHNAIGPVKKSRRINVGTFPLMRSVSGL